MNKIKFLSDKELAKITDHEVIWKMYKEAYDCFMEASIPWHGVDDNNFFDPKKRPTSGYVAFSKHQFLDNAREKIDMVLLYPRYLKAKKLYCYKEKLFDRLQSFHENSNNEKKQESSSIVKEQPKNNVPKMAQNNDKSMDM
jgi:hypothetical protein